MSSHRRSKENRHTLIVPISTKNSSGQYEPTIEGHVALNRANEKDGGIDMTLHFALKNKNEQDRQGKRSRSVPRHSSDRKQDQDLGDGPMKQQDKRRSRERHSGEPSREYTQHSSSHNKWSEILRTKSPPARPSSYVQYYQAERDVPRESSRSSSKSHSESERKRKMAQEATFKDGRVPEHEDASSFSALNPRRTLLFLLDELQNIVKPKSERELQIFKLINETVSRIPIACSPDFVKPANFASDPPSKHSRSEVSILKYETLRKEKNILQMKLDEKSKSHLLIERKLASSEAKISRLSSEVAELRECNEKLVDEQKKLLASIPILRNNPTNKNLEHHLQNEMSAARIYIRGLEDTCEGMQKKFRSKLKVIQDILNNSLDFNMKENPRVTDVVGLSPFDIEPLDYPNDSIQAPSSTSSKLTSKMSVRKASQASAAFTENAGEYINKLMLNSGLLKPDQEHLFQSFQSIPDEM